jgi:hypothetical protein
MNEIDKPKIDELAQELAFWNSYRERFRRRGIDIAKEHAEWTIGFERGLAAPEPKKQFAELCRAGCFSQALALLTTGLQKCSLLTEFWAEAVGSPGRRDEMVRRLDDAI